MNFDNNQPWSTLKCNLFKFILLIAGGTAAASMFFATFMVDFKSIMTGSLGVWPIFALLANLAAAAGYGLFFMNMPAIKNNVNQNDVAAIDQLNIGVMIGAGFHLFAAISCVIVASTPEVALIAYLIGCVGFVFQFLAFNTLKGSTTISNDARPGIDQILLGLIASIAGSAFIAIFTIAGVLPMMMIGYIVLLSGSFFLYQGWAMITKIESLK